jgi:hypothetical protein
MGMGTRKAQEKQEDIWIASMDVARSPGHPFYLRLNGKRRFLAALFGGG